MGKRLPRPMIPHAGTRRASFRDGSRSRTSSYACPISNAPGAGSSVAPPRIAPAQDTCRRYRLPRRRISRHRSRHCSRYSSGPAHRRSEPVSRADNRQRASGRVLTLRSREVKPSAQPGKSSGLPSALRSPHRGCGRKRNARRATPLLADAGLRAYVCSAAGAKGGAVCMRRHAGREPRANTGNSHGASSSTARRLSAQTHRF
jgi:hypothetical protein